MIYPLDVFAGPEVLSQSKASGESDPRKVVPSPVGDVEMGQAIQQIIAQLLAKNDKFFYKMPTPDGTYKLRDQEKNIQSTREYSAPSVPFQEYSRENFAPAPIASNHHSVLSPRPWPEMLAPYDQSLKPNQYKTNLHHERNEFKNQPRVMASSSVGRTVSKQLDTSFESNRGMNRRERNNKYYFDNFKHNLGSGMKSFASYVKVCLPLLFYE